MFNFWTWVTRNGHLAQELWHVCARGGYDMINHRVTRGPVPDAAFQCARCCTGMGA